MDQSYFVVEFAHSLRGRVKRIRITQRLLAYLFGTFLLLLLFAGTLFSSYLRMSWKASHYEQLAAQLDHLRGQYHELQRLSREHTQQIASLEDLANEVSTAYGLNRPNSSSPLAGVATESLTPTVEKSIEQYNFLKAANFSTIYHRFAYRWQVNSQPSLWPVTGVLTSAFGGRTDPLSGEGAFHTGVDVSVLSGTPVHATADGVVTSAAWNAGYGKLIIVDHGNGLETYYAHLSQFLTVPGQEVRMGQVIGLSGATGRVTSPHLHYEVRVGGTPVNPYHYLAKAHALSPARPVQSDLGL